MRTVVVVVICLLSSYLPSGLASIQDSQRFALVVGNQNYPEAPLSHTLNDATAIASRLNVLGFEVSTVTDANSQSLANSIINFYATVRRSTNPSKLAIVYYAGHAIQVNHVNYLVPLGIEFNSQDSFIGSLYNLSDLFEVMQNTPGLQNIVILDACRNNPFDLTASINVARGLAPVKAPPGTLIAFATAPGGVASDGKRKNGTYTKHLLRHIESNLSVEEVFKKVRAGVARETRNKQIPWEHSSLVSEVYFNPPKNKDVPSINVF